MKHEIEELTNSCPVCQSAVVKRAICKDEFLKASRRQANGASIIVETDIGTFKGIARNHTRYEEFRAIKSSQIEGVKTVPTINSCFPESFEVVIPSA
ncbi:MAG: hypothetical protein V7L29_18420 [Nostoc sp.]|uniref:hypothetical protein n=1 Tax=Nostoc sp. TaxID=1180 RepID=UPI002FEF2132